MIHIRYGLLFKGKKILSREPKFSSPGILEKLHKTEHPLILKVMGKTAEK